MDLIKKTSTQPVINADHVSIKESSKPRDNSPSIVNATQGSWSAGNNIVKLAPTRAVRKSLRIFLMTDTLGHFTAAQGYTKKPGASRQAQN
ncbi:hypothetical protein PtB15_17B442 [Puccinia triticina]|nr:hypothetical protein PtB15_17B442 [Puccinia triticina]